MRPLLCPGDLQGGNERPSVTGLGWGGMADHGRQWWTLQRRPPSKTILCQCLWRWERSDPMLIVHEAPKRWDHDVLNASKCKLRLRVWLLDFVRLRVGSVPEVLGVFVILGTGNLLIAGLAYWMSQAQDLLLSIVHWEDLRVDVFARILDDAWPRYRRHSQDPDEWGAFAQRG